MNSSLINKYFTTHYFFGQTSSVVSILIAIFSIPLYIKHIGIDGYGAWLSVMAYLNILSMVYPGFGSFVLTKMTSEVHADSVSVFNKFLNATFLLSCLFLLFGFYYLLNIENDDYLFKVGVFLYILTIYFSMFNDYFGLIPQLFLNPKITGLVTSVFNLLGFVVLYFSIEEYTYASIGLYQLITQLGVFVSLLIYYYMKRSLLVDRPTKIKILSRFSMGEVLSLYKIKIVDTTRKNIEIIIVSDFFSDSVAGIYGICQRYAYVLSIGFSRFGNYMFSLISRSNTENINQANEQYIDLMKKWSISIFVII